MGLVQTIFTVYIFISVGFYLTTFENSGLDLGINELPDILHIDTLVKTNDPSNTNITKNSPDINSTLMQGVPTSTQTGSVNIGSSTFSVLTDGLKIVFRFIGLLINLITMPINLMLSVSGMPIELIYLIVIPMGLMITLGVIFMIRGFNG